MLQSLKVFVAAFKLSRPKIANSGVIFKLSDDVSKKLANLIKILLEVGVNFQSNWTKKITVRQAKSLHVMKMSHPFNSLLLIH